MTDCDLLLQIPAVRERIASSAAKSEKRMTGEQFLELCDKFISPLTAGVPLVPVAKISVSFYAKLGVKTGKARTEYVRSPIGSVIVDTLCSLAERGQELKSATSAENGCVLEAALPSDLLSFAGSLIVTLEQSLQATRVEAVTVIPGQLYDWGKSNRALNVLFAQLEQASRAA
ncbi:zinc ribbon domain-containing protein [Adhaeretor mobilis]|nr:zinc ribbon domain-containing protein [Adhaeretor mobilis]